MKLIPGTGTEIMSITHFHISLTLQLRVLQPRQQHCTFSMISYKIINTIHGTAPDFNQQTSGNSNTR